MGRELRGGFSSLLQYYSEAGSAVSGGESGDSSWPRFIALEGSSVCVSDDGGAVSSVSAGVTGFNDDADSDTDALELEVLEPGRAAEGAAEVSCSGFAGEVSFGGGEVSGSGVVSGVFAAAGGAAGLGLCVIFFGGSGI